MTTAPLERLDTELIEALDFDPDLACEHEVHARGIFSHGGPAWALIERLVCHTHKPRFFYICEGAWNDPNLFGCDECGFDYYSREQVWRFISKVEVS